MRLSHKRCFGSSPQRNNKQQHTISCKQTHVFLMRLNVRFKLRDAGSQFVVQHCGITRRICLHHKSSIVVFVCTSWDPLGLIVLRRRRIAPACLHLSFFMAKWVCLGLSGMDIEWNDGFKKKGRLFTWWHPVALMSMQSRCTEDIFLPCLPLEVAAVGRFQLYGVDIWCLLLKDVGWW